MKESQLSKIKEQIELIDVDILDLNEDYNLHNSFFLTMIGGSVALMIGIFVNLSNIYVLLGLILLLILCLSGAFHFFRIIGKIHNKVNKLSEKKKKLIKEKYI